MKTVLVIQNGVAVDAAAWDGSQPWWDAMTSSGFTLVDVTSISPQPCIGWTYDGTNFEAPVQD
jgi:hypothetical protein